MEVQPPRFRDALKKDPLGEFFCWWNEGPSKEELEELKQAVDAAKKEEDIQSYLSKNPYYMIQHLSGGHGRYVIPKQKLGTEHVTDFMVAERNSVGLHWTAVELEHPQARMFTKKGDPTAELTHAIRQIMDWRTWITNNIDYARRRRKDSGLGLEQVDGNVRGIILIGRNSELTDHGNSMRRRYLQESNIEIHTFDWLLDVALKPGLLHPGEGLGETVIRSE